jgi:hypothetical protein
LWPCPNAFGGADADNVLFWSFVLGAVATIASYFVVAHIQIDTLAVWLYGTSGSVKSLLLLLLLCLSLFVSFVPAGIVSATLFSRRPEGIGGLYFADLLGAAIACGVVIYVISSIGAPATVMLAAAAMAAGALWVALRLGWALIGLASVALIAALGLTLGPGLLPSQRLDTSKTAIPPGTLAFSGWGSVLHVDLARAPGYPDILNLYHDGILGASIDRWNGKQSFLTTYDFPQDPRSFPHRGLLLPPPGDGAVAKARSTSGTTDAGSVRWTSAG